LHEEIKIASRKKAKGRFTTEPPSIWPTPIVGVILLRRLYKESIEAVQQGRDPLGVIRDPAKNQLIRLMPHEDLLD
jgi:hypothetical protein